MTDEGRKANFARPVMNPTTILINGIGTNGDLLGEYFLAGLDDTINRFNLELEGGVRRGQHIRTVLEIINKTGTNPATLDMAVLSLAGGTEPLEGSRTIFFSDDDAVNAGTTPDLVINDVRPHPVPFVLTGIGTDDLTDPKGNTISSKNSIQVAILLNGADGTTVYDVRVQFYALATH